MQRILAAWLVAIGAATGAAAQSLPSDPVTFAEGDKLVLVAEDAAFWAARSPTWRTRRTNPSPRT